MLTYLALCATKSLQLRDGLGQIPPPTAPPNRWSVINEQQERMENIACEGRSVAGIIDPDRARVIQDRFEGSLESMRGSGLDVDRMRGLIASGRWEDAGTEVEHFADGRLARLDDAMQALGRFNRGEQVSEGDMQSLRESLPPELVPERALGQINLNEPLPAPDSVVNQLTPDNGIFGPAPATSIPVATAVGRMDLDVTGDVAFTSSDVVPVPIANSDDGRGTVTTSADPPPEAPPSLLDQLGTSGVVAF